MSEEENTVTAFSSACAKNMQTRMPKAHPTFGAERMCMVASRGLALRLRYSSHSMMRITFLLLAAALFTPVAISAADTPLAFKDPKPQRYELSARASELDPRVQAHPEIDF